MHSGVIPGRGLVMETIAGVFSAIARGLRGLFDLASMAVGVAPAAGGLGATFSAGVANAATSRDGSLHTWRSNSEEYEFSETFKNEVGWTHE
jgi:hypothetical protein